VAALLLGTGIDISKIGESGRCNGFSGADLASLVREACVAALKVGVCTS
jgi:ribosome biogenesis ATPase